MCGLHASLHLSPRVRARYEGKAYAASNPGRPPRAKPQETAEEKAVPRERLVDSPRRGAGGKAARASAQGSPQAQARRPAQGSRKAMVVEVEYDDEYEEEGEEEEVVEEPWRSVELRELPPPATCERVWLRLRGFWVIPGHPLRDPECSGKRGDKAEFGACGFPNCILADRHHGPHEFEDGVSGQVWNTASHHPPAGFPRRRGTLPTAPCPPSLLPGGACRPRCRPRARPVFQEAGLARPLRQAAGAEQAARPSRRRRLLLLLRRRRRSRLRRLLLFGA